MDTPFLWSKDCDHAFADLKSKFTNAPILCHFQPELDTIVETDASDFALGAVLSQKQPNGATLPVAFYSRKFNPSELNYTIYDKEMLAIVEAIRTWRAYLEPTSFLVLTDHRNLIYFEKAKVLNRRHARWSELLSSFSFKISYRPGIENGKADLLSRRADYFPENINPSNMSPILPPCLQHLRFTLQTRKFLFLLFQRQRFCLAINYYRHVQMIHFIKKSKHRSLPGNLLSLFPFTMILFFCITEFTCLQTSLLE